MRGLDCESPVSGLFLAETDLEVSEPQRYRYTSSVAAYLAI